MATLDELTDKGLEYVRLENFAGDTLEKIESLLKIKYPRALHAHLHSIKTSLMCLQAVTDDAIQETMKPVDKIQTSEKGYRE